MMINYSELIGIPFVNRGRDYRKGLDCYGLVQEVYRRNGIELPEYIADFNDIGKINQIISYQREQNSLWQEVDRNDIPELAIVAIRFGVPRGIVNHVGVYIGQGKFLHIRENTGVCVDRITSPEWQRLIVGFYIYRGENNG